MKKLLLILLLFSPSVSHAESDSAKEFRECRECSASERATRETFQIAIRQMSIAQSRYRKEVKALTRKLERLSENVDTLKENQNVIRYDQKGQTASIMDFENRMLGYFKPISKHLREHKKD